MVVTSANIDLFQNLHFVILGHAFLQQFLLRILAHKFLLDQHIMLAMSYEAFHLGLVLGNLCRGEILDEWLHPVSAGGQNHSDQLVYRRLFSHRLLFFLDGRLNKVMNENSMGDHYPG
jgi:hypothetical protein